MLSKIQLFLLVFGSTGIVVPDLIGIYSHYLLSSTNLAAYMGLTVVAISYLLNRFGYIRVSSFLTVAALDAAIWSIPVLSDDNSVIWAYYYLIIPILLADMFLGWGVLALFFLLNLAPMSFYPALMDNTPAGEVPILFYSIACVIVVLARHHRIKTEALRQRELRLGHERYQRLLAVAFKGVALEREGELFRVNDGFLRIFACTEADVLGHPLSRFIPDGSRILPAPLDENAAVGGALTRLEGIALDGSRRVLECTAAELAEAPGAIILGIRDVTEESILEEKKRLLEEQMQQGQRLESLGLLAGGIAHDFNNLLAAILGQASLLELEMPAGTQRREIAHTIAKAAEQASDLTEKLLGFARQGKHQNVVLDVPECIADTLILSKHMFGDNIAIVFDRAAGKSLVKGDPVQLQQVFLNLLLNARDAMPGGGKLSIRTENAPTLPGATDAAAPAIVVHIADTGTGIAPETLPRIFDPFFTTKPPGQGTGLGLAMVYGIVESHGGTIEVKSQLGEGTEVAVYLPATTAPLAVQAAPAYDVAPALGMGRILVVDDEPLVRTMVQTLLGRLGYKAILAENGKEGAALYAEQWREIDLAILDLVMPVMGGEACFHELKKINPRVKVILSSGYGINERTQALLDAGVFAFVKKPYRLDELSQAIESAMRS